MTITTVGSMLDQPIFDKSRRKLMTRSAVEEQLDQLQALVRAEIAKFSDTGQLWESVSQNGPYRSGIVSYRGEVYSDLEYTAAIEYGWGPRKIEPKRHQALRWGSGTGIHFSKGHYVGGFAGHHMFAKATAAFERGPAEDIVEEKVRRWFGAVDAGKRSVVF